jgi:hypothetical protein
MNYLVFLDTHAHELEKILSGTKSMLIKEFDHAGRVNQSITPGDGLYFLRNHDDNILRVKATVEQVWYFTNHMDEDLSHVLKEFQPRLQLTEEQYNYWSVKQQSLLVEFGHAQKINQMHIALSKFTWPTNWIAFEEFNSISE